MKTKFKEFVLDNDPISGSTFLITPTEKKIQNNYYKHNKSWFTPIQKISDDITLSSFINPNVTNFKYMSMLKNYFNLTYTSGNFTTDERKEISDVLETNTINTILPKITKITLNSDYTFIHKYCNNCYVANNAVYMAEVDDIIPSSAGVK